MQSNDCQFKLSTNFPKLHFECWCTRSQHFFWRIAILRRSSRKMKWHLDITRQQGIITSRWLCEIFEYSRFWRDNIHHVHLCIAYVSQFSLIFVDYLAVVRPRLAVYLCVCGCFMWKWNWEKKLLWNAKEKIYKNDSLFAFHISLYANWILLIKFLPENSQFVPNLISILLPNWIFKEEVVKTPIPGMPGESEMAVISQGVN